jgi:putative colanic acid biosynthesis UDP-glucose lipid carrier transferase
MSVVNLAAYKAVPAPARLPDAVDAALPSAPRRCSQRITADLVRVADVACVLLAGLIPLAFATQGTFSGIDWVVYAREAAVAAAVTAMVLTWLGQYDAARLPDLPDQPLASVLALAAALATVTALGLAVPPEPFATPELWMSSWLCAALALVVMSHSVARSLVRRLAAEGRFDRRVAIYGAGPAGRRIHDKLIGMHKGVTVVGLFDDRLPGDRLPKDATVAIGRTADLCRIARAGDIDEIIIAVPPTADRRIEDIARRFEQLPADIRIATHIASDYVEGCHAPGVSMIGEVGLIDIKQRALTDWSAVVKRVEDVVLALVLIVLCAPLFPIIAAAIKLDSDGPVLFRQRRRGLNQRIVNVLKFRTMTVLEDSSEVRQAMPADPRITRVGRFLRRTSLDELPQLFNVLSGEMSLVGPRPHALVHDEHYGALIENYANRHQVKPGITGLAQVRGHRGETSTADKMQMRVDADLSYIRSWSLWLDLKILIATVWTVAGQKNAH